MAQYYNCLPGLPHRTTTSAIDTPPALGRPASRSARLRWTLEGLILSVLMLLAGCSTAPRTTPAPVEEHGTPAAPAEVRPLAPVSTLPPPSAVTPEQRTTTPETVPAAPTIPAVPPPVSAPPPQNRALVALLQRAEDQTAAGQLESAASSLERALRIDAQDPEVWHELARVRLRQQDLEQARDLARKSNSLAAGRHELQARNWRLIAVVLKYQGDNAAADEALAKARGLEQTLGVHRP